MTSDGVEVDCGRCWLFPAPGNTRLDGAAMRGDRVIGWSDTRVHVWSEEDGWISLPETSERVRAAIPLDTGFLVVLADGESVGFVLDGRPRWCWWGRLPSSEGIFPLDGREFVASERLFRPRHLQWHRVDERGMHLVRNLPIDSASEILWAWRYRPGASLAVLHPDGICTYEEALSGGTWRERPLTKRVSHLECRAVCCGERLFASGLRDGTTEIRIDTGRVTDLGLGFLPEVPSVWSAYAREDRLLVDRTVGTLAHLRAAHGARGGRTVFALHWRTEEEALAVTSDGAVLVRGSSRGSNRSNDVDLLSWQYWLRGKGILPDALEALATRFDSHNVLLPILEACGWSEVFPMLFDRLRLQPRESGSAPVMNAYGIHAVARAAGSTCSASVVLALEEDHPAVLAAACLAAGTYVDESDQIGIPFAVNPESEAAPAIWDGGHPAPTARLCVLASHPDRGVRSAAIEALGVLRDPGAADTLADLLVVPYAGIRKSAARALLGLPVVPQQALERLERLAGSDPDEGVREMATGAFRHTRSVESLIACLADYHSGPRRAAEEVLPGKAALLGRGDFDRLLGLYVFCEIARAACGHRTHVDSPEDAVTRSQKELAREVGVEAPDEFPRLTGLRPDRRDFFRDGLLCGLFCDALLAKERQLTADDAEILRGALDAVDPLGLIDTNEIEEFLGGDAPLTRCAAVALRVAEIEPTLGKRLACVVAAAAATRPEAGASSAPGADGFQPLHDRLRRGWEDTGPMARCRALARSCAESPGIEGLTGSIARWVGGERGGFDEFVRRVLSGDGRETPVAVRSILESNLFASLPEERRAEIFAGIVTAPDLPLELRVALADDYDWRVLRDRLRPECVSRLLRECLESTIPFEPRRRVEMASELFSRIGDSTQLEEWERRLESDPVLAAEVGYVVDRGLAMTGRPDSLDRLRASWIRAGDLDALEAFARHGTEGDIAMLEQAMAEGAPESMVRPVIEAIRGRYEARGES